MAHGRNAAKRGHNREYWSRRPFSMIGWGRAIKIMTHRQERRVETRRIVAAAVEEHLDER